MEQTRLGILCCLCLLIGYSTSQPPATPKHDPLHAISKPSEQFTNHEILDPHGNYELFWKYNKTHITFETHVKTLGYVGFGLSPHGKMFPADMVIGWVKDGTVHFKDRHSIGHYEPVIDQSQDWFLLFGKEENDKTILKFTRKLISCDIDDMIIENGTVKVIYAWHPEDPQHETGLPYHGDNNKGSSTMLLLSPTQHRQLPPDSKHFDFYHNQFHLPGKMTHYQCTSFRLPDIGGKHHMVMFEPILQKGNEEVVHHMLLYHCPPFKSFNNSLIGRDYECYSKHAPKELQGCGSSTLLAWAVGGGPMYFPDYVGIPIAEQTDSSVFILETHYNNPTLRSDIVDSSGLRMHFTPTLRKNDGGVLVTGLDVNSMQAIPPGYKDFVSSGYCNTDCTTRALQNQSGEVKIFGIFPHSHLLGNAVRARIIRNGVESVISDDEHYDFDYQETRLLNKEVTLKAGDVIKTECLYKSDNRKKVTYGGLSTLDEMCLSVLWYYPRFAMGTCVSHPYYNNYLHHAGKAVELHQKLSTEDWTNQTIRDSFQKITNESNHKMICLDKSGRNSLLKSIEPPPIITTKYVARDACTQTTQPIIG